MYVPACLYVHQLFAGVRGGQKRELEPRNWSYRWFCLYSLSVDCLIFRQYISLYIKIYKQNINLHLYCHKAKSPNMDIGNHVLCISPAPTIFWFLI